MRRLAAPSERLDKLREASIPSPKPSSRPRAFSNCARRRDG
jgi:hypothetical protein